MINLMFVFTLFILGCTFNSQISELPELLLGESADIYMPESENKAIDEPNIKEVLGAERVNFIAKSNQVTVYRVKEFVTDSSQQQLRGTKVFASYEVVSSGKLNKKKIKTLRKSLLDAKNYIEPQFVNKCTFTATVGWKLKLKNQTINLIMSYPCKTILFLENGQEIFHDVRSFKMFDQIARSYFKDLPPVN